MFYIFVLLNFIQHNKMTMQLLCFTDCTNVQILAVSILLSSSKSVGSHCICANVYNAQHGKLEAKFLLSEPSSTSELHMCNTY